MIVNIKKVYFAACVVSIASICIASKSFDRYQTVIDRKPFGPEPVNFDPEAAPGSAAANAAAAGGGEMTEEQRTEEEQQLAASVRVAMINITPAGAVAVGFTDSSVNPVVNYYLKVGESQNGWTVKSADPSTESVTLEKGGIEVTVKLGESSGNGKANGTRSALRNRPMTLEAKDGQAVPTHNVKSISPRRMGGLARLRQRRAEMQEKARADAAKKAQADAVAAAEREERAAREEEERRAEEERKAREAEERAQQRETLRQIQEQLRKDREARDAAKLQAAQGEEGEE